MAIRTNGLISDEPIAWLNQRCQRAREIKSARVAKLNSNDALTVYLVTESYYLIIEISGGPVHRSVIRWRFEIASDPERFPACTCIIAKLWTRTDRLPNDSASWWRGSDPHLRLSESLTADWTVLLIRWCRGDSSRFTPANTTIPRKLYYVIFSEDISFDIF